MEITLHYANVKWMAHKAQHYVRYVKLNSILALNNEALCELSGAVNDLLSTFYTALIDYVKPISLTMQWVDYYEFYESIKNISKENVSLRWLILSFISTELSILLP